ncbi:MAG: rhodanese-like domain-containing protein [Magnetococcales bacterium]|nr:rhodanese-like domain-containing protein [Magnetococcales bacterium]
MGNFEHELTLLLFALALLLLLRGPILARFYRVGHMTVHDLAKRLQSAQPPLLIDVRTPREVATGYIRQALCIPLSELKQRAGDVVRKNSGREIVVICERGNRSIAGSVTLRRSGAAVVYSVAGGLSHWRSQGYPVCQ